MEQQHSAPFLRKRKFFVLLPILVAPLITLFFGAMGGGQAKGSVLIHSTTLGQLNRELPDAHNTEHTRWTKLDYYKQADADSAKRKAAIARDPYYQLPMLTSDGKDSSRLLPMEKHKAIQYIKRRPAEVNADKLTAQLNKLNQQLNATTTPLKPKRNAIGPSANSPVSPDVQKLEAMMHAVSAQHAQADPEMEQLNSMLAKILDIQHPERVQSVINDSVSKANGQGYAVSAPEDNSMDVLADSNTVSVASNGFYSLDNDPIRSVAQNSFAAVMAETQTLVSGAIIKLRLAQEMAVNGLNIPADQLVYGIVHLNGERLLIDIKNIRVNQQLLPVHLSVYDLDGLPGIYIPGAITREVAKQSASQSMQQIGLGSFDPSIGAQAASAGIQAAKTLLQKKVQQIKVTVQAGYEMLLKDNP